MRRKDTHKDSFKNRVFSPLKTDRTDKNDRKQSMEFDKWTKYLGIFKKKVFLNIIYQKSMYLCTVLISN